MWSVLLAKRWFLTMNIRYKNKQATELSNHGLPADIHLGKRKDITKLFLVIRLDEKKKVILFFLQKLY